MMPLIQSSNLTVSRGGAPLISGVSFTAGAGGARLVALVGDVHFLPGLLTGAAEPSSGELTLAGIPARHALQGGVRLLPAGGLLWADETVFEGLRWLLGTLRIPSPRRVTEQLLRRLDLGWHARARPSALEPAELRALCLHALALSAPQLIVLEQPLDGLDELRGSWLVRQLTEVASRVPLLWTTEALSTASHLELAQRGDMAWLRYGALLSAGPAREVLSGDSICLVRVAGDGAALTQALAARQVTLERLSRAEEPSDTCSFRLHSAARSALVACAVETQTPVLELSLIEPLSAAST